MADKPEDADLTEMCETSAAEGAVNVITLVVAPRIPVDMPEGHSAEIIPFGQQADDHSNKAAAASP